VGGTTLVVVTEAIARHRHGHRVHTHPHVGPHRHLRLGLRRSGPSPSLATTLDGGHTHPHDHGHGHGHDHSGSHSHSHGLVDRSIVRSREGVKAVAASLAILGLTALAQLAIFLVASSVALLADLVHNFGDALTAVPLGIAFFFRSFRGEKLAGLAVVIVIFFSACVALYETVQRFLHPEDLTHLLGTCCSGRDRVRRERACREGATSRGSPTRKPGADRGRQPRPNRWLRLARRPRERDHRRAWIPDRRSGHRPRHHTREPR
jgi:hypothetical protein